MLNRTRRTLRTLLALPVTLAVLAICAAPPAWASPSACPKTTAAQFRESDAVYRARPVSLVKRVQGHTVIFRATYRVLETFKGARIRRVTVEQFCDARPIGKADQWRLAYPNNHCRASDPTRLPGFARGRAQPHRDVHLFLGKLARSAHGGGAVRYAVSPIGYSYGFCSTSIGDWPLEGPALTKRLRRLRAQLPRRS